MPSRCSFSAVTAPTPQSRSTGSGSRNASSRSGSTTSSPSGLLTALATLARNFVRATPTEIARPDLRTDALTQSHRDLLRRAGDAPEATDLEERLVDREALHERRRIAEDREDVLAGRRVRLHPRSDDHGIRAQVARLPASHRRADPAGLRLVARRQHHAAADDDRPAAKFRARRAARPTRRTRRDRRAARSPRPASCPPAGRPSCGSSHAPATWAASAGVRKSPSGFTRSRPPFTSVGAETTAGRRRI